MRNVLSLGAAATLLGLHAVALLVSLAGPCVLLASTFCEGGSFSLEHWKAACADLDRWAALCRASATALAGALLVSIPLGTALAWILFRSDAWLRKTCVALLTLAASMPLYITGASFLAIAGPAFLQGSAFGAGLIHGAAYLPLVTILTGLGLRTVNRDLEEAALLEGAGPFSVFWKVTLRYASGAVAACLLVVALWTTTDYSISDVLLVRTFAEEVYTQFAMHGRPEGPTLVVLPQLVFFLVAFSFLWRTFLGGEGQGPEPFKPLRFPLGRLRPAASLGAILVVLAVVLGPAFLLAARLKGGGGPLHYLQLFRQELQVSLACSFAAGASCALLAPGLAWCMVRRGCWRAALALYVLVLLAFPAPLLGVGLIQLFNREGFLGAVYDSPAMLVLAYAIRFLPLAVILCVPPIRAMPVEYEMAARVDGAGTAGIWRRIVIPACWPSILAVFLIVSILSLGELPCSLLVTPPGYITVGARFFSLVHYGLYGDAAALCLLSMACVVFPWALLVSLLERKFQP